MPTEAIEPAPARRCRWRIAAGSAVVALMTGCDDPAIRDVVRIDLRSWTATGETGIPVTVETRFKPLERRTSEDEDLVQRTLDHYALGRDPWIRGFQRAGADKIDIAFEGPADRPSMIRRTWRLPDAQALVSFLPDAIANVTLRADERRGTMTLEIVHIDAPEHVRDARREIERELDAFARLAFDWSESVCDFYAQLHEDRQRGRLILASLRDGAETALVERLDPEAAAFATAIEERFETMEVFLGADQGDAAPERVIVMRNFRPFDHELEIALPAEAIEAIGFERVEDHGEESEGEDEFLYTLGTVNGLVLLESVVPATDPPFPVGGWDEMEEDLEELPAFTCRRQHSALSIKQSLWDKLLPASHYELTWPSR